MSNVLNIKWMGKKIYVLITCDKATETFKTTAYEDENRMMRVWDERINSFFDTEAELNTRVKELKKKSV